MYRDLGPTDDELAKEWIDSHQDFCFDSGSQCYREYKDGCWNEVPLSDVMDTINQTLSANTGQGVRPTKSKAQSVEYFIQTTINTPADVWDARTNILVLLSKTLEWASDGSEAHLRKHSALDCATKKLDIDYDNNAEMPAFKKVLDAALPDKDSQRMLQEYFGLCLTTVTDYQIQLWLEGEPGSGKTTMLDAIVGLLGNDNLAADLPISATVERFGRSHIGGATLLWSDEQSLDKIRKIGPMSSTVDGGFLRVERKFRDPMSIRSTGKLLWVMNQKPEIIDSEGINVGLWRRLNLLMFVKGYERKDVSLYEQVMRERAGLLKWAVEGLMNLLEREEWLPCTESELLVEEYRGLHAPVQEWFEVRCLAGKDLKVRSKRAYRNYVAWTGKRKAASVKEFVRTLRNMGYRKRSSGPGGQRTWHGFTVIKRTRRDKAEIITDPTDPKTTVIAPRRESIYKDKSVARQ